MFPKEFIMLLLTMWLTYSISNNPPYQSLYPTYDPEIVYELIDLSEDEDTEDETDSESDIDNDCLLFEDDKQKID